MAGYVGILGVAAGGGSFTPASLPNLSLWLDASDASTFSYSAGTTVSEWRDKSGNARHFNTVQATAPERNATVNSLDAVAFNGGGLRTSGSYQLWDATTQAQTTFAVFERTLPSTGNRGILFTASTAGNSLLTSGTPAPYLSIRPGPINETGPAITLGQIHIVSAIYTGYSGSAGTIDTLTDDTSDGTTAGPGSVVATAQTMHLMHNATSYFTDATCCEIITCATALGTTDYDDTMAYLAAKWGVTI